MVHIILTVIGIWFTIAIIRYLRGDVNNPNNSLLTSAMRGDTVRLEKCLDKGADIDFQGSGGFTALIWASQRGHIDTVNYLLENGADVTIKTDHAFNALSCAAIENHIDILKVLAECAPESEISYTINNLEQSYNMELSDYKNRDEAVSILKNYSDNNDNNFNEYDSIKSKVERHQEDNPSYFAKIGLISLEMNRKHLKERIERNEHKQKKLLDLLTDDSFLVYFRKNNEEFVNENPNIDEYLENLNEHKSNKSLLFSIGVDIVTQTLTFKDKKDKYFIYIRDELMKE